MNETLNKEGLMPLQEAVEAVAGAAAPAESIRWAKEEVPARDGTRHRLEATKVGRRWFTSKAAVRRFLDKLNKE